MDLLLPKNWKSSKLENILDYVIGGDWGKDESYIDSTYDFAYCIRGAEIKNWDLNKGNTASLRKIKISNIQKRKLEVGDILVEISGGGPEQPVGRTVLIDNATLRFNSEIPKICTNFLRLIRPNKAVDPEFLNLYLKLFYYSGEIVKFQAGSNNLRNLKFPDFIKINVPLPPLATQLSIVSKIEELFSELDAGIANLKTAQQQLKTFRQSVLKWAFEGKLTNKNVKDGELPKEWKRIRLGEVANSVDPQPSHRTPPEVKDGIPYVSIKDFDPEIDKIDFTKARKVSTSVLEEHLNRYKLEIGDFVIGKIGTIGKPVRIVLPQNYTLSANIVLIQPRKIEATYLYYFFQSNIIEKAFTAGIKATTQAAFGIQKVRELQIALPSKEEQNQIVQEIENRLSVADKMEESINQSLQQAEALRQSILKKAFEGGLV